MEWRDTYVYTPPTEPGRWGRKQFTAGRFAGAALSVAIRRAGAVGKRARRADSVAAGRGDVTSARRLSSWAMGPGWRYPAEGTDRGGRWCPSPGSALFILNGEFAAAVVLLDLPCSVCGVSLFVVVAAGTVGAGFLHIPAAAFAGDDVTCRWSRPDFSAKCSASVAPANQLRHSASRREYILLRIITADGRPHNPYRLRVFDCCSRVHWIAAIFTPWLSANTMGQLHLDLWSGVGRNFRAEGLTWEEGKRCIPDWVRDSAGSRPVPGRPGG